MTKILMVCLGNICRSPLAEGILKSKLSNAHIVDSRQFVVSDFDTFDMIYVMDESNYQNVLRLARDAKDISKMSLILNEVHPNMNFEVPDPYYGGDHGFETMYHMLDEACDIIAQKIS